MFKFFKDKLKGAIDKFSKKVEEEVPEEKVEEIIEEEKPAKEEEEVKEEIKEEPEEEISEPPEPEEKKGFFKKIKETVSTKKISEGKFDELFDDLEIVLLENNVAVEVIDKIKRDLKMDLVDVPIPRSEIEDKVIDSLKESIRETLSVPKLDITELIKKCKEENKPAVFVFLGYNGSGKSLSVARVANYLKSKGMRPLLAAGDTFRAAGDIQLREYAKKINLPVIKHQTGGDSCAVIYDAVVHAKAKNFDVVLADTAGRIQGNVNLMDELKKIIRINKPDLKILVIDALTGTDSVEQARQFNEIVGVDAVVFTKVDVYEKGGGILNVAYILDKPILFLGCGQGMNDIQEYDVNSILKNLGF